MPHSRKPSRRLFHVLAYGLITLALLLLLLPQGISQGLRYALLSAGAGAVEIDNVDINLFSGTLALDELQVYRAGARVLQLGHAELEIDWQALLQKRIALRQVTLERFSISVVETPQGAFRIGGFPLPDATQTATTEEDKSTSSLWGIGISQLALHDNTIYLIRPHQTLTLQIEQLETGTWQSWAPEVETPLSATLVLDESKLAIDATAQPFSESPTASFRLQLSKLNLTVLSPFLPAGVNALEGLLSGELEITLRQQKEALLLSQQGSLSLPGLRVQLPQLSIQGRQLHWTGSTELLLGKSGLKLALAGTLDNRDLQLQMRHNRIDVAALRWQGNFNLEQVRETTLISAQGDIGLEQLVSTDTRSDNRRSSLQRLEVHGLDLAGMDSVHLERIQMEGLSSTLRLTRDGLQSDGIPVPAKETATDNGEAASATGDSIAFTIGKLELTGNNRIQFSDQTISPSFQQTLYAEQLTIGTLNSRTPEQETPFSLNAALDSDRHSRLTIEGRASPLLDSPRLSLGATISNYEMPPLNPYVVRQIGYKVNSGQLNGKLKLNIARSTMKGEATLKARQLEMQPEDPERISDFEQKISLPLSTALSLLRDKQNNIELKIPFSGRLNDPKFDVSDAINTALANTARSATISYLKYLLQPYSSVITLAQLAGKAGGAIQLEPIKFIPGQPEPEIDSRSYIDRLAELLDERKQLQLRLCGIATTTDLAAISGNKVTELPPGPNTQLEQLARERAESLKRILVTDYGLAPGRLFVCDPTIDRAAEALPRVRLQL